MEKVMTVFERKGKYGIFYSGQFHGKWVNIQKGKGNTLLIKDEEKKNQGMLWQNTSKSRRTYYTGYFGTYENKVIAFVNLSKDGKVKYMTIYKQEHVQKKDEDISNIDF